MDTFKRPDKTDVRAWLLQRQHTKEPPPCIDEIRRALGWIGIEATETPASVPILSSVITC